jgi:hypothetical protein
MLCSGGRALATAVHRHDLATHGFESNIIPEPAPLQRWRPGLRIKKAGGSDASP